MTHEEALKKIYEIIGSGDYRDSKEKWHYRADQILGIIEGVLGLPSSKGDE